MPAHDNKHFNWMSESYAFISTCCCGSWPSFTKIWIIKGPRAILHSQYHRLRVVLCFSGENSGYMTIVFLSFWCCLMVSISCWVHPTCIRHYLKWYAWENLLFHHSSKYIGVPKNFVLASTCRRVWYSSILKKGCFFLLLEEFEFYLQVTWLSHKAL